MKLTKEIKDIEKSIKSKAGAQLMSSESANNSAVITSLVPLIILGLPILASEALILELMNSKTSAIGINWFLYKINYFSRLEILMFVSLIVTCIMYVIATTFSSYFAKIFIKIPAWFLKYVLSILIFVLIFLKSYNESNLVPTLITLIISIPMCLWGIKSKINMLPLVFSFLLSSTAVQTGSIVWSLITK